MRAGYDGVWSDNERGRRQTSDSDCVQSPGDNEGGRRPTSIVRFGKSPMRIPRPLSVGAGGDQAVGTRFFHQVPSRKRSKYAA
jgi:hypothetical protein